MEPRTEYAAVPLAAAAAAVPTVKPHRRIGWIIAISLLTVALIAIGIVLAQALTRLQEAQDLIQQQDDEIQEQDDLIDGKETFSGAMTELLRTSTQFDGALYSTLLPQERWQDLADDAWDARRDSAQMAELTDEVRAETSALETRLATVGDEAAVNISGTTYEQVVDSLGLGFVATAYDDADAFCGRDVWGCVSSEDPHIVHIDLDADDRPYMNDVLRTGTAYHEFAHVLQFTNPDPTAVAVESFGGDWETMADCFALTYLDGWTLDHRIFVSKYEYWDVSVGYGYTCTDAQRQVVRDWYGQLGYTTRTISQ